MFEFIRLLQGFLSPVIMPPGYKYFMCTCHWMVLSEEPVHPLALF